MNKNKLKTIATSLFSRAIIMCLGIALLIFLGPAIFANVVNPPIWFGALIALYFLISGIFAIVYFFSKKVLYLLIVLPALAYFLVALMAVCTYSLKKY